MDSKVKIVTFAPKDSADEIRNSLGDAGTGIIGEYTYCSFTSVGHGRFVPSEKAKPAVGSVSKLNTVEEERIEVVCSKNNAKAAITALRKVHPYEDVALDIYPLLSEEEL